MVEAQCRSFLATEDQRVINAWVAGLDRDAPLQVGQPYELKFNVDLPRDDARTTVSLDYAALALIASDDFDVESSGEQRLDDDPAWALFLAQ